MVAKIIDFAETTNQNERSATLFQIKATVLDSEPPIWRRLLVPAQVDFDMLVEYLVNAFDWYGYHLYYFEKGGTFYDDPQLIEESADFAQDDEDHFDASEKEIGEELLPGDSVGFVYDLGDCWSVLVEVEKEFLLEDAPYPFFPVCLDGARRAPLEDSGGMGGYEDFCQAVVDPKNERYEELREWACLDEGEDFDPEHFETFELNSTFAYAMLDALEDELIPDDPADLKEMCKDLMAEKMALMASFAERDKHDEDADDEDDDF